MAWVPGVGHVPGTGPGYHDPYRPYAPYVAGAIVAADAIANANAMAAATAQANNNAMAVANAQAAQANNRAMFVQALQMHLGAIGPLLVTNPEAMAHLNAAQSIAAQLV
jgi:hypothetical protein